MEKMSWKNALVLLLLTVSLSAMPGCQSGSKRAAAVSDAPPGADNGSDNRVLASMGAVNLGRKQVVDYLQALDPQQLSAALGKEGGLEELVKGVALRANVVTRAAAQNWQDRPEVKSQIEETQRNILYTMYINEKSEPPADYPDDAAVTQVYEASQQQRAAAGTPALKPLKELAPLIKQRLREKQRQLNEKNYLEGLVSSNPVAVDGNKLVGYLKMPQEQRQQQEQRLQEPVARMGNLGVTLGLALKSLGSLEPPEQRQVLNNPQLLQQYLNRLAIQYFVINEAVAAKFSELPVVINHMEQARLQVVYTTYMKHWSAPEEGFPGAALIEENYKKNLEQLVVPDRYRLAKIVIANSADSAADEARARQVAAAARAPGADFASLARQYSQEPQSAKNGGVVGWLNTAALLPELSPLIRGNPPGAVIGPIQHSWGWQVVKILDHQTARQQTLEEARPALVTALRNKRSAEKEQQLIEQLLASEPVTIDKDALAQLRQQISG